MNTFEIDFDFIDHRLVVSTVEGARWDDGLGEFVLPYEVVSTAEDPDAVLLEFLQQTYEAAATTAEWDRDSLERNWWPND